jgi:two-component system NtrC family sensor kinase
MSERRGISASSESDQKEIKISITTKLILSFLLIIVMTSAIFTGVGIWLFRGHIEDDAQEQTRDDLENAREIYLEKLNQIGRTVRSTAVSFPIREAILTGDMEQVSRELMGIKIRDTLDLLTITDESGKVLFRTGAPGRNGDNIAENELIYSVINDELATTSTTVISQDHISKESPFMADNAQFVFNTNSELNPGSNLGENEGMILGATAPIYSSQADLIGVVYGGVLLNDNLDFICEIKQGVYKNQKYEGQDLGMVTIYQNGIDILTCPRIANPVEDSPTSDEMFEQVVEEGSPWIGKVNVDDRWYVSVAEPIRNSDFENIGMLQVARLEQKYLDINQQIVIAFVTITIIGALLAILFAYFISKRISLPLKQLVSASRNVAQGNLDARVDINSMSNDELGEMGDAFNAMTYALEERDEKLRELTQSRIRRSERLALIGKLSADIAHELNNPLQGIVTYSHLILEHMPEEHPDIRFVEVIVTQANRCREIIRGLLDFARQREPDRSRNDINTVLQDTVTLLENQALFHNIQIEMALDPELPLAVIDPSQMERVFMNMIINAAEAMEGQGNLTLTTEFDPIEEQIIIFVSDTGNGINEDDMQKIFDPFFTTKEVGQGTGLGLALSYGIIREHDGSIAVESEVGKGTTFSVRLPAALEEKAPIVNG